VDGVETLSGKEMFKLSLGSMNQPLRLLCIGAHSDDIEIGCGGTILRMLEEYPGCEVYWVILGATGQRIVEAEASASLFLARAKRKNVIIKEFRDGFFPYNGAEIKSYFEELKLKFSPDLIFTHYRHDLHQDHRLVSELSWNTFRNHLILEYEIMKYDGDIGNPNFFVHLDEEVCRYKIQYIIDCFRSQQDKNWFTEDVFYSILRLRGLESNAPNKYAEGFYCRKMAY
jgi:LmbE family N-acetylglucosaminyl deacetylase